MRIYIHNNKNDIIPDFEPYFYTNRLINNKTTGDVLLLENNRIYRMKPANKKSDIKTILGIYPVTIKSDAIRGEECYQIPPQSKEEILTHKVYKKGLVEWIFVYNDENVLLENYFSLPEGMDINNAGLLDFLGESPQAKQSKAKQGKAKHSKPETKQAKAPARQAMLVQKHNSFN